MNTRITKYVLGIVLCLFFSNAVKSQVVYEHLSNEGIYGFLDEMANINAIQINDVVKPYSRQLIFEYLLEIESGLSLGEIALNKRQMDELKFYLSSYILENQTPLKNKRGEDGVKGILNPPGLFFKNEDIKMGLQMIWGGAYSKNDNDSYTESYGGASMMAYIGDNIGVYGNVRDRNIGQKLISPSYLNQIRAAPHKEYEKSIDFSETRGGFVYSWEWGNVGLIKDHIQWGTGYNGTNIQSGRNPSFAMLTLKLKPTEWFEFNYIHGWLNSEVVDSVNSYWTQGTFRPVYRQKYIAANMFTFYPWKKFNFSFGNSIVYSDLGGINASYLIPFLFYKSVDHTLNSTNIDGETGQNAQLFLSMSSRNIKNLHLHFTLYADDLSFTHFKKKDEFNFFSYKLGARLSNYPFENFSFTFEFTHTNPLVFQHKIGTQTYETSGYNLGHYLRDNAREYYLAINYKPIRGLSIDLSYEYAKKGDAFSYAEYANIPYFNIHTLPILENIIWSSKVLALNARYEIKANVYIYINIKHSNITGDVESYTPEYYWGKNLTFTSGLNIGF